MNTLKNKQLVLGLSGGVACYKSAELCRLLVKAGAHVQVVMTEAATRFITPETMQALSGQVVHTSAWAANAQASIAEGVSESPSESASNAALMPHIHLTRNADAILVAPASANFMAKVAHGQADDLLSLLVLARPHERVPLLLAPAMNREMWANPATQRNAKQLQADGVQVLPVGFGEQACGEVGDGRMLEATELLECLQAFFTPKRLSGKTVLLTAGPTFEAMDPVRGMSNRSSGKMGFALAQAAQRAGANVILVTGPVALPTPWGVERIDLESAVQMNNAVQQHLDQADVLIAAAAVADWRIQEPAKHKIKKSPDQAIPQFALLENPDILALAARSERAQNGDLYCVGFAAESQDLEANTRAKRERKGVPLLIGNLGPATFGHDENEVLLVDSHGCQALARASKAELASQIIAAIAQRLA